MRYIIRYTSTGLTIEDRKYGTVYDMNNAAQEDLTRIAVNISNEKGLK